MWHTQPADEEQARLSGSGSQSSLEEMSMSEVLGSSPIWLLSSSSIVRKLEVVGVSKLQNFLMKFI